MLLPVKNLVQAKQAGIALISGAGFDVIPTDCLAMYVAQQVPDALHLEIGISLKTRPSAGTTKSMLEMLPRGVWRRREGELLPYHGSQGKIIPFAHRRQLAIPTAWGDLVTAYHSTGIPNITTYMAYPASVINLIGVGAAIGGQLFRFGPLRRAAQWVVSKTFTGPDEDLRQRARSHLWAKAWNEAGQSAEARLETMEAYRFTAVAGVRAVEAVLAQNPIGALSPAQALGVDFALEIPETKRELLNFP